MPDFQHERREHGIVAGVDEVGRGPLAGPVVAAAVILDESLFPDDLAGLLDDSKKITLKRRTILAERLRLLAMKNAGVRFGLGLASVEEIDRINILQATFLAMKRACDALNSPFDVALVDGNRPPPLSCTVRCLIGGDALSLSIAAASILAKDHRDRLMCELAQEYPGYGWEKNAGYGTAAHRQALFDLGVTPHHRRSFAPVAEAIAQQQ